MRKSTKVAYSYRFASMPVVDYVCEIEASSDTLPQGVVLTVAVDVARDSDDISDSLVTTERSSAAASF